MGRFSGSVTMILVLCALLSACQKKPITYYRGTLPEYRMSPDGRYYPIDTYGKFAALSMDYRETTNDGLYYYPCPVNGSDNEPSPMYGTTWMERQQVGKIPEAFKGWQQQIDQAMKDSPEHQAGQVATKNRARNQAQMVLQGQACPMEPIQKQRLDQFARQNPGYVIPVQPPPTAPPAANPYPNYYYAPPPVPPAHVATRSGEDNDTAYQIPLSAMQQEHEKYYYPPVVAPQMQQGMQQPQAARVPLRVPQAQDADASYQLPNNVDTSAQDNNTPNYHQVWDLY